MLAKRSILTAPLVFLPIKHNFFLQHEVEHRFLRGDPILYILPGGIGRHWAPPTTETTIRPKRGTPTRRLCF